MRRELDELRTGLERDGLVLAPADRIRFRLAALPLGVLSVIGVVRVVAVAQDGMAARYIVLALIATAFTFLMLFFARVPRVSRAGHAALAKTRTEHGHLNPSMSPAWATYGAAGAALGTGLFGRAALMSLDPDFAEHAQLNRRAHDAGSCGTPAGGGGAWCGSSGGSSCGGSSCSGGSCGGGSCGGGGGT